MITWCIPIVTYLLLFNLKLLTAIYLSIILIPIVWVSFFIGTFGWIWAISIHMKHKLPNNLELKTSIFKFLFTIMTLLSIVIILKLLFALTGYYDSVATITTKTFQVLIIVIFFIIIWTTRFAAKTIKSIELGRIAKFTEYLLEFFLINFSFIGFWIIQPRINRILNNNID